MTTQKTSLVLNERNYKSAVDLLPTVKEMIKDANLTGYSFKASVQEYLRRIAGKPTSREKLPVLSNAFTGQNYVDSSLIALAPHSGILLSSSAFYENSKPRYGVRASATPILYLMQNRILPFFYCEDVTENVITSKAKSELSPERITEYINSLPEDVQIAVRESLTKKAEKKE